MAEEDDLGVERGQDGRWVSILEPGEYDGYNVGNWDEDTPQERWFLPVSFNCSP